MPYNFEQLLDTLKIGKLLEAFCASTQMSCALFDAADNNLLSVGWHEICSQFHREHPISAQRCRNSDAKIRDNLCSSQFEHRCENGMMYVAMPILLEEQHIGTLVTSQFFYEDTPPDRAFFVAQAEECGFDQKTYLAALAAVPVLRRDQIERNMLFLQHVVNMLVDMGQTRLDLANKTESLQAAKEELEASNHALVLSEARYRAVTDQSLVGITVIEDDRYTYTNNCFADIFQLSPAEALAMSPLDCLVPDERSRVAELMHKRMSGELDRVHYGLRCRQKSGAEISIEVYGNTVTLNGKRVLVNVIQDITERNRAEQEIQALQEKLQEQSMRDSLTGLYNRRYLEDAVERELRLAERHKYPVSLILGDLDHFKQVNDQYGHLAGDEVLRSFSLLLGRSSRSSDINCRYGGEEFLLIMPRMTAVDATERAELLRNELATTPITFDIRQIAVTASFGISSYPANGQTLDQLIAAADKALYAAKEAGRNLVQFCRE